MAGLAFVAATYHLTETAHRQAELARLRQESAQQQAAQESKDGQEKGADQEQVLEWLAPDMLDRADLRSVSSEKVLRLSTGVNPAFVSSVQQQFERERCWWACDAGAADVSPPIRRTCLSDRSTHGPPRLG